MLIRLKSHGHRESGMTSTDTSLLTPVEREVYFCARHLHSRWIYSAIACPKGTIKVNGAGGGSTISVAQKETQQGCFPLAWHSSRTRERGLACYPRKNLKIKQKYKGGGNNWLVLLSLLSFVGLRTAYYCWEGIRGTKVRGGGGERYA